MPDYFADQTQFTRMDDKASKPSANGSGLLQGAVLPLYLFLTYVRTYQHIAYCASLYVQMLFSLKLFPAITTFKVGTDVSRTSGALVDRHQRSPVPLSSAIFGRQLGRKTKLYLSSFHGEFDETRKK